jgi:chemotaxis signal transduction protein
MTTMVQFRTTQGQFCIPIENVREVRQGDDILPLPLPRAGVVGVVHTESESLTVVSTLGGGDGHVLVLNSLHGHFGLLADEVCGIVSIEELEPAPRGQATQVLSGVARTSEGTFLVVDVNHLAEGLST